ncbi:MAG: hypothetical protein HYX87_05490 [Chloroflexi bacterium]|nr:hypothetical protein [Chloroflexota bacterium]
MEVEKLPPRIVCTGIADLYEIVEALSPEGKALFNRIFHIIAVMGYLDPPPEMISWIGQQFGSVDSVVEQKVTKITNMVTFEGALYNSIRASRPIDMYEKLSIQASIIDSSKTDPLHDPLKLTPADPFGRIRGKYCITASNVAKYDGLHGLVIFDSPNPLAFEREQVHDYLDTAWKWAQKAHEYEPEAKYYLFIWNCLRRAGASLLHGHAQMTLGVGSHYPKIEALRRAALAYKERHGSSYFDDLVEIHDTLGLTVERNGVRLFSYLTPVKEKEIMVLSQRYDDYFKDGVYDAISCLRDMMNVTSFNLMVVTPPIAPTEESWEGFPAMARVVDRGQPKSPSCDIGTMELYASPVISSDPFEIARLLKLCTLEKGLAESRCQA